MKVKQETIKMFEFEIEDEESFLKYFQQNFILLKNHLMSLKGYISPAITQYLDNNGVCYVVSNNCVINKRKKNNPNQDFTQEPIESTQSKEQSPEPKTVIKEVEVIKEIEVIKEVEVEVIREKEIIKEKKPKVYYRPIRSGEEIKTDMPINIFDRINSGARVITESSIEIFGIIEGIVACNGDYMIIKQISPKGNVLFHDEALDRKLFNSNELMLVTYKDGTTNIARVEK